jgi:hypothetical protein
MKARNYSSSLRISNGHNVPRYQMLCWCEDTGILPTLTNHGSCSRHFIKSCKALNSIKENNKLVQLLPLLVNSFSCASVISLQGSQPKLLRKETA